VALRFFLALWIRHGSEELTPEPEPKYPVQEAGLDLKPRQSGQKATPGEKPPSITGRTTTGSTDSTAASITLRKITTIINEKNLQMPLWMPLRIDQGFRHPDRRDSL
jgi:hypothetical protein